MSYLLGVLLVLSLALVGSECVSFILFTMLETEEEGGAVELSDKIQITATPGNQGDTRQAILMLADTLIIIYHACFHF